MVTEGDFHEEDEPVADVVAAFDAGMTQLDDVACDDERKSLPSDGACEISAGVEVSPSGQPRVRLCGQPARLRGIAYMCDSHFTRWRARGS